MNSTNCTFYSLPYETQSRILFEACNNDPATTNSVNLTCHLFKKIVNDNKNHEQNSERHNVKKNVHSVYDSEGCGICEKSEGNVEIFWFSKRSRAVHERCWKLIQEAETDLNKLIEKLSNMFEKYDTHHYVRVDAHVAAIEAVRNETEGLSLRLYVQRKGVDNLKKLFNTIGAQAAGAFVKENAKSYIKVDTTELLKEFFPQLFKD